MSQMSVVQKGKNMGLEATASGLDGAAVSCEKTSEALYWTGDKVSNLGLWFRKQAREVRNHASLLADACK